MIAASVGTFSSVLGIEQSLAAKHRVLTRLDIALHQCDGPVAQWEGRSLESSRSPVQVRAGLCTVPASIFVPLPGQGNGRRLSLLFPPLMGEGVECLTS